MEQEFGGSESVCAHQGTPPPSEQGLERLQENRKSEIQGLFAE